MLLHFAEGTRYLPADSYDRAKAYEWLFFEQYTHEPAVAVRISIMTAPERAHLRTPERLDQLLQSGNFALGVMEKRLANADWLAGESYSIADMALYAYTHRARLWRLRSVGLSRDQRLARTRGLAARPRADRVASGRLEAAPQLPISPLEHRSTK